MLDHIQIAVDRIGKFNTYAEAATNTEDKKLVAQAMFNARREFIMIQRCFANTLAEGELIYNSVLEHHGIDFPSKEKEAKALPAIQEEPERRFLGDVVTQD